MHTALLSEIERQEWRTSAQHAHELNFCPSTTCSFRDHEVWNLWLEALEIIEWFGVVRALARTLHRNGAVPAGPKEASTPRCKNQVLLKSGFPNSWSTAEVNCPRLRKRNPGKNTFFVSQNKTKIETFKNEYFHERFYLAKPRILDNRSIYFGLDNMYG